MIRHSPCGRAVDIARRNYSTKARPFRDSDTEVTIKWRRADPAAGTLPYPSRLCSLDWATQPWLAEGAGEVFGEARTFLPKSLPTFLPTDHICGTRQDHEEGGKYLPDEPPVTFREDGLPTCCGPIPEPEPPPVGSECELAQEIELDELYEGVTGPVGTVHWLKVVGITGGNIYSSEFTNGGIGRVFIEEWKWDQCPPPFFTILAFTSSPFSGFSFGTFGTFPPAILVRFTSEVEGEPFTYRMWLGL